MEAAHRAAFFVPYTRYLGQKLNILSGLFVYLTKIMLMVFS